MKANKLLAMLLAAVMAFSATACSSKDETTDNAPAETTPPKTEDVTPTVPEKDDGSVAPDEHPYYNVTLGSDPTSLDISKRSDSYSSSVIANTNECLVRNEAHDGQYVMSPGDAQSWETSEDGLVWTFHLGDNTWNDGEPVTAQQYVYSLRRSADPATGCPNGWFLSPILNYDAVAAGEMAPEELGVKAIDDKTLEITLSEVTPAFLMMCDSTVYYAQREDKITEWGDKYGTEPQYTMYNGPYTLDEWVHNSKLVMNKRDGYWNAENVKMETITFNILADTTSAVNAYKAGELDYIGVSQREWVEEFMADEHSVLERYPGAQNVFTFFNTEDPVFSNQKIRQAFNLCIDQDDFIEMVFNGNKIRSGGWVPGTMSVGETMYRDYAGDFIQNMKDELAAENKTCQDLLLEGMEEANLGSDPATLDVTLMLAGSDEWFRTFGEYLQQVYLDELGVDLKIEFSEWGIFSSKLDTGDYQMGYMAWGAYYNDPYDMLSLFTTDVNAVSTNWSNTEFDELVYNASHEMDEAKRLEMYAQAEKILMESACAFPIGSNVSQGFYKDYVKGYSSLAFSSNGYKYMYTAGRSTGK